MMNKAKNMNICFHERHLFNVCRTLQELSSCSHSFFLQFSCKVSLLSQGETKDDMLGKEGRRAHIEKIIIFFSMMRPLHALKLITDIVRIAARGIMGSKNELVTY